MNRRFLLALAILAVVAGVMTGVWIFLAPHGVVLPEGGRARVLEVTCGTRHRVRFPVYSWGRNWQDLPKTRSPRDFAGRLFTRPHGGAAASSTTPSTVVWFLITGQGGVKFDAVLVLADGRRFTTKGANGSTFADFGTGALFPVVSTEDPTLRVEIDFGNGPQTFTVPNPAYGKAGGG